MLLIITQMHSRQREIIARRAKATKVTNPLVTHMNYLHIYVAPHGSSAYVILLGPIWGKKGSSYSHFADEGLYI